MADNFSFFGQYTGIPELQAQLLIEFTKDASKYAYQQYCNVVPVKSVNFWYPTLKNDDVVRDVNQDMNSWADGADNPATGEGESELFELKEGKTQRYTTYDRIVV